MGLFDTTVFLLLQGHPKKKEGKDTETALSDTSQPPKKAVVGWRVSDNGLQFQDIEAVLMLVF